MGLLAPGNYLIKRTPLLVFIALLLADIVTIALSMYLAYQFYHFLGIGAGPQPLELYLKLTFWTVVVMLIIFQLVGLYEAEISILNIEEVRKIFKATFIGLLLFFFLTFYTKFFIFSRLIITFSAIFLIILVSFERLFFYKLHQKLHMRGFGVNRVLIYGAGEVGQLLLKRLMQSPALGYLPVGFVDDHPQKAGKTITVNQTGQPFSLPVLGKIEELSKLVEENKINELFITITSIPTAKFNTVVQSCRELGVEVRFVPNLFDLKVQKISVSGIDGIPLLSIRKPKVDPIYAFFKRAFDLIVSSFVIVITSPFVLLIAFLIRRDSPGPVIFKQKRIGYKGKEFLMYKFRTMWADAKAYDWTPTTLNDNRITRFGKFLRRTSLDELPQFWNVLKGAMSIVGPRPEMPFIVEMYTPLQRDRLEAKPGITGLWQISADRGKQIHDNIEYDLYYIENCGFILDLVIVIRTVYFAIRGIGAF